MKKHNKKMLIIDDDDNHADRFLKYVLQKKNETWPWVIANFPLKFYVSAKRCCESSLGIFKNHCDVIRI